jgi:hypothetical protein
MSLKRFSYLALTLLLAGCNQHAVDVVPAGESYFPLSVGNRWVFDRYAAAYSESAQPLGRDTVLIDARTKVAGRTYYHLRTTWPGFSGDGGWVRRDTEGNLFWSAFPGGPGNLYMHFDAAVGQRWPLPEEFSDCLQSLQLLDDYAVVNTPAGRFDGAREIGGGWIDCTDFGWTADFARGVGPVRWEAITIAGPTNWLLVAASIHEEVSAPVVDDDDAQQ